MIDCFANGTYQLADLDGALHASRVNGLCLKMYHARFLVVVIYDMNHYSNAHNYDPSRYFEMDLHMFFATHHE